MSICHRIDELRDYALDELAPESRNSMEQHFAGCSDCAAELDRLRLTTAALRILPDHESPSASRLCRTKSSSLRRRGAGWKASGTPGRGWALRRRACWRWR